MGEPMNFDQNSATFDEKCFFIAVMLPSIFDHESFLQECCSVFYCVKAVGDGCADDKQLSRVSLTCFIMRTH